MNLYEYLTNKALTEIEEGFFGNIQALPDNVKYNLLSLQQSNVPWSTLRKLTPEKFEELFKDKSLVIWVAADLSSAWGLDELLSRGNNFRVSASEYGSLYVFHDIQNGSCGAVTVGLQPSGYKGVWSDSVQDISGYNVKKIPVQKVIDIFNSLTRKVYNNSARLYVVDAPTFGYSFRSESGFCYKNLLGDFKKCLNDVTEAYEKLLTEVRGCCKDKPTKKVHGYGDYYYVKMGSKDNIWNSGNTKRLEFTLCKCTSGMVHFFTDNYRLPWVEFRDNHSYMFDSPYGVKNSFDGYYKINEVKYNKIMSLCKGWEDQKKQFLKEYHNILDKFLGKIEDNPVPENPTPAMAPIVAYVSPSGRTAASKDQENVTIFDVNPPKIEIEKSKKLLSSDGKGVNDVAYAKFLKLSNTQLKVSNRTHALLQHIKDNGGDVLATVKSIDSHWTGYFQFKDIFGQGSFDDIIGKLEKTLK